MGCIDLICLETWVGLKRLMGKQRSEDWEPQILLNGRFKLVNLLLSYLKGSHI